MVAGDGHSHVDRIHGLVAVRHVEGDLCEVIVRVRELLRAQAHVRRAGIRLSCLSLPVEGEVIRRIQVIADLHVVSADAVIFGVQGVLQTP